MNRTAKDLWKPKRRIESLYQKTLVQLMKKLQKNIVGLGNPSDILNQIRKFMNNSYLNEFADSASMKMVTHLFTDAGSTWREAARENSKGRIIYEALRKELKGPIGFAIKDQIQRNAEIIKSLPLDISREVTRHVLQESLKGRRASDIADDIEALFPLWSKAKAKLIARTEVSKTSTALTQARCEDLGLDWYNWRTSEDSRVRSSHKHMEGVLVKWSNPPSPEELIHAKSYGHYHAGNIFNCRCYPEPVIALDAITWPHKVYFQGKIQTMSRKQFERIA